MPRSVPSQPDTAVDERDAARDGAPTPDDPEFSDWVERQAFTADGVDRTLLTESLARTPAERLARLQAMVDFVWSVRGRETGIR